MYLQLVIYKQPTYNLKQINFRKKDTKENDVHSYFVKWSRYLDCL